MKDEYGEYELVAPPMHTVTYYDYLEKKTVVRTGYIESSGHFIYLMEKMYSNGGAGAEMFSVSPDNYWIVDSEGKIIG